MPSNLLCTLLTHKKMSLWSVILSTICMAEKEQTDKRAYQFNQPKYVTKLQTILGEDKKKIQTNLPGILEHARV